MSLDLHVLSVVETLYDFLDRSPSAVLLLDEQRRIVYANPQAAVLHARGDGISLTSGGLMLARKQDDVRLQERIAAGLATNGASAAVMRVQRMSGRRPYAIFFAPVAAGPPSSRIRPALCVVITDPEAKRDVPIDRLQDLFGLTESESRLTALLSSGEDLKSAAKTLGITYGTARARLAEIFQKTETRRQGELINLVLTTLALV
ncbi:MAG TPA: helix-turn-helix transcriptional regulator [Vicinamibacterales bacterium]|nr:helix-turn-helix transcriptional regulator [Vicinamibacterales bacterium]